VVLHQNTLGPLGVKVGVAERPMVQLGVDTLLQFVCTVLNFGLVSMFASRGFEPPIKYSASRRK
jgi:hypothetical protein